MGSSEKQFNFGKNFMNHLLGTETEEEKKRQMCMSKFILVVDDAFDVDEEEQAKDSEREPSQEVLEAEVPECHAHRREGPALPHR